MNAENTYIVPRGKSSQEMYGMRVRESAFLDQLRSLRSVIGAEYRIGNQEGGNVDLDNDESALPG